MTSATTIGLSTAAGAVVALLAAWHAVIYWEVDVKCEKPKHTVIRTLPAPDVKNWMGRPRVIELRRYAPVLAAQVTFQGTTMRESLQGGFRQIAGFIFGKNKAPGEDGDAASASSKVAMTSPVTLEAKLSSSSSSSKVAMTSPVTLEENAGAGEYVVSFIMPSKYTKETLPTPINDNVKIIEVPSRTMAAIAFRGRSPSEDKMHSIEASLRRALEGEGLNTVGTTHLWQYHPPFAPFWMRRNEVLVEVKDDGVAATS